MVDRANTTPEKSLPSEWNFLVSLIEGIIGIKEKLRVSTLYLNTGKHTNSTERTLIFGTEPGPDHVIHRILVRSTNQTFTNGHLSTVATFVGPGSDVLSLILTLYYGHLSTTATASKTHLILPIQPRDNGLSINDCQKEYTKPNFDL